MTAMSTASPNTVAASRHRPLSAGAAWAAAACLVVPAAVNTAYHLLTPVTADATATAVAQAAAHPVLAQVAVLLQFALPVLAPGVAVLAWKASAAAPRLALAGGVILGGAYLLAPLSTVSDLLQGVVPHVTSAAAAAQVEDGYGHTIAGHIAVVALVAQALGWIVMAAALWRSRIVPRWLAAAFGLTFPLQVLTHAGSNPAPALSWGWFTLVLIGCGVFLVRSARAGQAADAAAWPTVPPRETMAP